VSPCHLRSFNTSVPLRGGAQSHCYEHLTGIGTSPSSRTIPQTYKSACQRNAGDTVRFGARSADAASGSHRRISMADSNIRRTCESSWADRAFRVEAANNWARCMRDHSFPDRPLDYLPDGLLERVVNVADFARVLVLDKWTCNADGRQAVFHHKRPRSRRYTATFVDQGYCFNAGEWTFPDYPLRGVYATNCVYQGVTGWERLNQH